MLCPYKDIFGKPGTGVHAIRVFDVALVDVALTVIAAYYISKHYGWSLKWTIFWAFIIGEIFHYIFCVETTVIKLLTRTQYKTMS